ncbi:MAG: cell division protein ZapD [Pseudomonadota bacterium]
MNENIDTAVIDENAVIIYEQPLDELIRVCLRLEYLFQQMDHLLQSTDLTQRWEVAISYLIAILHIADRPDLKSKITKKLNDYSSYFAQLATKPNIDKIKLNTILQQFRLLSEFYLKAPGKMAQTLKNDPFMDRIYRRLSNLSDYAIDTPIYSYWRAQSSEFKEAYICRCLDQLLKLRETIDLLLQVNRDSGEFVKVQAKNGFYHQNFSSSWNLQLLRIAIPRRYKLYPEVSAGKHRMSARFLLADLSQPGSQSSDDVSFYISCCAI